MRRALAAAMIAALVAAPGAATAAPGTHGRHHHGAHHQTRHQAQHPPPAVRCSRGLVALTFDDGPSATVTPRLVRTLQRLDVPATFFMVGSRIASAPAAARMVAHAGFAIGNHTWAHTDLTTQTRAEIHQALAETRREMHRVGITPTHLVRPPYGAVNDRVRRLLAHDGDVPVLWTVDSRDWAGSSPAKIVSTVLGEVVPHPVSGTSNIVLQHDGVTNSPATVRALPSEVAQLRRRGYCFAALDDAGELTPPVPTASISAPRTLPEGHTATLRVSLDRPTSRPVSVVVEPSGPADVGWRRQRVRFAVGETVARLRLPIRRDGLDEPRERIDLALTSAQGLAPAAGPVVAITVLDRDGPPEVALSGGSVTESSTYRLVAPVGVRLSHVSGHDVRVQVRTRRDPGGDLVPFDGWVVVPAGAMSAPVPVEVRPGPAGEGVDTVGVRLVAARHATPTTTDAAVQIRPAVAPPRMQRPRLTWW